MRDVKNLIKRIDKLGLNFNAERIEKAYKFAFDAHDGQKRFSGEPYIGHPVEVAYKLLDFFPDEDMVVAALLHDVSEDTDRTLADIERSFGLGVRKLVSGLEKLSKVRAKIDEPEIENLRKMFMAMATDLRVIMIKLCDRWHNMETLGFVREEKQRRIAKETLEIYVPIASRLGIYVIKNALEDLCFKHLHSELYKEIEEQLLEFGKQRTKSIDVISNTLQKFLNEKGIVVKVEARVKTHYSIYKKLKRKGKTNISDIFDVFAVRAIVMGEDVDDSMLYKILGLIHGKWTPLAPRFKDYIAVPKSNGYRSLHTTVVGLGPKDFNQPVEVQIRTAKMHEEAEFGIASHWLYEDEGKKSEKGGDKDAGGEVAKIAQRPKKSVLRSQIAWLKALNDLQKEVKNNSEFIHDLKTDLFNDRIFVLTPNGDVKDLPAEATPIDFAYAVHTDVGNKTVMAKVDGVVVPLNTELKNGQVVDIVTKKDSEPNQFWLSFVKTNGARNRIKAWFKGKDSDKNLKAGRELVNKALEKFGQPALDAEATILKKYSKKDLTLREREELLVSVGAGVITPGAVVRAIYPEQELLQSTHQVQTVKSSKKSEKEVSKTREGKVIIDGQTGIPFRFGACCKPKMGTPIVGYISSKQVVTIHSSVCKMLLSSNPSRLISVQWNDPTIKGETTYQVNILLKLEDRVGLLRDITNVISDVGVNIVDLFLKPLPNETNPKIKLRSIIVEVSNYDQLSRLMNELEMIPSVLNVRKVD